MAYKMLGDELSGTRYIIFMITNKKHNVMHFVPWPKSSAVFDVSLPHNLSLLNEFFKNLNNLQFLF